MGNVNVILWSMTAMVALGVAAHFLSFWRQTGDRLFLLLAIAFGLMCTNTTLLAAINPSHESRHLIYILRLAAFLVIAAAIVDKNRSQE